MMDLHRPGCRRAARIRHDLPESQSPRPELSTPAMEALMQEFVLPRLRFVNGVIADIPGPRQTLSVSAQFHHYLTNTSLLRRIEAELVGPENAEMCAANVVDLYLAGLCARSAIDANERAATGQKCQAP